MLLKALDSVGLGFDFVTSVDAAALALTTCRFWLISVVCTEHRRQGTVT